MPTELSEPQSLFLHVRTHPQLQYYLNLSDTQSAANHRGLLWSSDFTTDKVVEIHPIARRGLALHRR